MGKNNPNLTKDAKNRRLQDIWLGHAIHAYGNNKSAVAILKAVDAVGKAFEEAGLVLADIDFDNRKTRKLIENLIDNTVKEAVKDARHEGIDKIEDAIDDDLSKKEVREIFGRKKDVKPRVKACVAAGLNAVAEDMGFETQQWLLKLAA